MGDPAVLQSLVQRVEEAKGPDRELDIRLHAALVRGMQIKRWQRGCMGDLVTWDLDAPAANATYPEPEGWPDEYCADWPSYTASIDAALALVERCLPGWGVDIYRLPAGVMTGERYWEAELSEPEVIYPDGSGPIGTSPSLPLAICLALLRSLQDQSHA